MSISSNRAAGRAGCLRTGERQVRVRLGYTQYDDFGSGFAFCAMGSLDAPDIMPQGSVRVHATIRPSPVQSIGYRDWATPSAMSPGASHDGPQPATAHLFCAIG